MHRLLAPLLSVLLAATATAQDPRPVTSPPAGSGPVIQDPKPATQDPKPVTGGGPEKVVAPGQKPAPQQPGPQQPAGPKPTDPKSSGPKPADPKPPTEGGKPAEGGEVTEVDLPEDVPLPASADPSDLRAMKSAQEMLVAERRLRARIKAGQIKDIDKLLSFEEISSWPYEDGLKGMPKSVAELDGKQVVMIGFMLPIDEVEDIKEFLLVQSLWACCFGQPPDINGIVRVVMKGDRRCDYQFDPILVKGTFEVEATLEDGYCIDIFQLHATEVSLLR